MITINGTNFDESFCKRFTPSQLKQVYNGESEETLSKLIEVIHPNTTDNGNSNSSEPETSGVSNLELNGRNTGSTRRSKHN